MVIQILGTMLHPVFVYMFVKKLDFGIQGIGIGGIVTNGFTLACLLLYSAADHQISSIQEPFDSRSFKGLGQQIEIAIPTVLMSVMDWWCFELLIAFSGFYDVHS